MSHKRAYEPQKRAYESQKRREKRENVLEFGRLETTGSHTSHIFSATQSTRQQDSKLVRLIDAVLEREKESSESLFIQHFAFLNTTVIAHKDIENHKLL